MGTLKYFRLLVLSLAISACATEPAQRPIGPQSAAIGIDLLIRGPLVIITKYAHEVYLIRLDEDHGLIQRQLFGSNHRADGRVYFLNVRPGRYAAVAEHHTMQVQTRKIGYMTYFPEDLIRLTEVTVKPGEFAFMGKYVVDQLKGFSRADKAQNHYFDLISPGGPKSMWGQIGNVMALKLLGPDGAKIFRLKSSGFHYPGTVHENSRNDDARRRFLAQAKEDLAASGWADMIDRQLSVSVERPGVRTR